MSEMLLILSEDAVFARMLELEFRMHRISARTSRQWEAHEDARVILVDLDSVLPPADCAGKVIGFTRSFSILASDPERRCSMILHRPFAMEMLTEEVRALLPETESVSFSGGSRSRPSLKLKDGALFCGANSVSLSPTEAALMECLLSARAQTVPRRTLEGAIGSSLANKTDVYICFLRKKLEILTGNTMIRTVRGVGYRLE